MNISIPDSMGMPRAEAAAFAQFLQRLANRRAVGALRYGRIRAEQGYMTRLSKELSAYRKSGNAEQLLNIAVYAFLESYAPEHRKAHFDARVDSVTRGKL